MMMDIATAEPENGVVNTGW